MAIQFARIEITGRAKGGNACCKSAYNARGIIKDEKTNITYNFQNCSDNIYHKVLLPEQADAKFQSISTLMNNIEQSEKQKNSQLLKDIVIALPDDKELNLQDRINITHRIIDKMEWVKNGLAVQIDIHEPHDGEKNYHAHLLVLTRRFTACGMFLAPKKARDLNPEFKTGSGKNFIVPEEDIIHEKTKRIINEYFEELGLDNRVDEIGLISQEHVGPMRMRSHLNQVVVRNDERKIVNIESLKTGKDVLDRITKRSSIFTKKDLERIVKCVPNNIRASELVNEALDSNNIIKLYEENSTSTNFYTTNEVRDEEFKLLRLSNYIGSNKNKLLRSKDRNLEYLTEINKTLNIQQQEALSHLLYENKGIRILQGRAGTGKSLVLGKLADIVNKNATIDLIGLAPTHKAKQELMSVNYEKTDTINRAVLTKKIKMLKTIDSKRI
jgi:hypothetical protein